MYISEVQVNMYLSIDAQQALFQIKYFFPSCDKWQASEVQVNMYLSIDAQQALFQIKYFFPSCDKWQASLS